MNTQPVNIPKVSFFVDDVFAAIFGHKAQLKQLRQMLEKKAVPHALLFSGTRGVGKWTIARCLATALLVPRASPGDNGTIKWEHIDTAGMVDKATHPDFHLIALEEGKKDITVEAIRSLCRNLRLTPYYAQSSVAIINDAHLMSTAACNAMLMTLEEPGADDYIILVSDKAHQLPLTILSRCQTLHFNELSIELIDQLIKKLFSGIVENTSVLQKLVDFTGGSLEALELEEFFDARTHRIIDPKVLKEHISTLVRLVDSLRGELTKLFCVSHEVMDGEKKRKEEVTRALSLASEIASDEERLPHFWRALRLLVRDRLRHNDTSQIAHYANLLLECVNTEHNVVEHNANTQLAISSLLLKTACVAE